MIDVHFMTKLAVLVAGAGHYVSLFPRGGGFAGVLGKAFGLSTITDSQLACPRKGIVNFKATQRPSIRGFKLFAQLSGPSKAAPLKFALAQKWVHHPTWEGGSHAIDM